MTGVLLYIAMREIWNWPVVAAAAFAACFVVIDGSFFAANMAIVLQGGWVPLLIASLIYGVMFHGVMCVWRRGAVTLQAVSRQG
jgi:KUP system potassium uptake protein